MVTKFYYKAYIDTEAVMSNVLSSETGMSVSYLMQLQEHQDGLDAVVR